MSWEKTNRLEFFINPEFFLFLGRSLFEAFSWRIFRDRPTAFPLRSKVRHPDSAGNRMGAPSTDGQAVKMGATNFEKEHKFSRQ